MKKLWVFSLLSGFLLFACGAHAQQKTAVYSGLPQQTLIQRGAFAADSGLYVMSGCGNPDTSSFINLTLLYLVRKGALIFKDTCNDAVWTSNPDKTWTQLGTSSGVLLQTNGVDNGSQSVLNLQQATGISIVDNGTGTVTITNTAPAPTQTIIDTTIVLSGIELLVTIPHGLGVTPTDILVQVDNELGLSTFVPPYFDATNIYIPYSIGPIGTFEYTITVTQ